MCSPVRKLLQATAINMSASLSLGVVSNALRMNQNLLYWVYLPAFYMFYTSHAHIHAHTNAHTHVHMHTMYARMHTWPVLPVTKWRLTYVPYRMSYRRSTNNKSVINSLKRVDVSFVITCSICTTYNTHRHTHRSNTKAVPGV